MADAHTPGPWSVEVVRVPHTTVDLVTITAPDPAASPESGHLDAVAHVRIAVPSGRDSEMANARLIAAAPLLLALVRDLYAELSERADVNFEGTGPNFEMQMASHIEEVCRKAGVSHA